MWPHAVPQAADAGPAADRQLARLGAVLLDRITELAEAMAERITAEVSFYRDFPTVSLDELLKSCQSHLEFVLCSLGTATAGDTSPAELNGRRRAGQDVPLPALMDAYRIGCRFHVVGTVLGHLNQLPAAERAVLLDTLEAWRDCGGSATQAADRLFCHPNTVRHRLRRITAATGRSLTAPRDVAELCLALEAARQQPAG